MVKSKSADNSSVNEDVMDRPEDVSGKKCAAPAGVETDNVSDESFESGDNPSAVADRAAEWQDKYMRLSAEFDNYRKRTLREKMELVSQGGEDVIRALLPVLDDMDRALEAVRTASDIAAVRTGIELIAQKLGDTLKSKGVSEIECLGLDLDTDFHEAVARIPVDKAGSGKIVDVVQKGYKYKDKVTRHAKVVVGE